MKRGEEAEKEATLHCPTPHVILWTVSLAKNSILQNKLTFWTIQKSFCVNPVQINNKPNYYFSSLHKVQVKGKFLLTEKQVLLECSELDKIQHFKLFIFYISLCFSLYIIVFSSYLWINLSSMNNGWCCSSICIPKWDWISVPCRFLLNWEAWRLSLGKEN